MEQRIFKTLVLAVCLSLLACAPATRMPLAPADLSHDKDLPLIQAIEKGNLTEVKALLDQGADPNMRYKGSLTPLMQTLALHGYSGTGTKICLELIRHGANVNLRNANYDTALIYAAAYGNKDIAKALLEKGADINTRNAQGVTSLHSAIIHEHHKTMVFFMEKGSDVNAQDILGISPVMTAASREDSMYSPLWNLVLNGRANVNLEDNNGDTVTSYCKYPFYEKFLRSKGAKGRSPVYAKELIPPTPSEQLAKVLPFLGVMTGSVTSTTSGGLGVDPNALGTGIGNIIAEKALEESPPEVMDVKAGLMTQAPDYSSGKTAMTIKSNAGKSVQELAKVVSRAWAGVGQQ